MNYNPDPREIALETLGWSGLALIVAGIWLLLGRGAGLVVAGAILFMYYWGIRAQES